MNNLIGRKVKVVNVPRLPGFDIGHGDVFVITGVDTSRAFPLGVTNERGYKDRLTLRNVRYLNNRKVLT